MFSSLPRFDFRNRVESRGRLARRTVALAGAAALVAGSSVFAQGAPRPEALIKWRQSAFQVVAWNTQRLKTALASDTGDAREVQAAANALAAVAASGLPELFPPGTEHGKGWRETTAAPIAFSDAAQFRDWRVPFGSRLEFQTSANAAWQSKFNSDVALSSYAWIPARTIVDFAAGIGTRSGTFSVNLLLKNALDDDTHVAQTWNSYGPSFPRWWGVVFSGRL
jgi:hypothetical protein